MYLIFILIPMCIVSYKYSRDAFNPAFLLSSSYVFVSLVIIWTSDLLNRSFELSTQLFIFFNVFVFFVGSLIGGRGLVCKSKEISQAVNIKLIAFIFIIIAMMYIYFRLSAYGFSLDSIRKSLHEIREDEVKEGHGTVQYLLTLIYALWAWLLIKFNYKSKINIFFLVLLLFVLMLVAVVSTSKQATFMLMISTFFLVTKRNLKSIVIFGLVGVLLFSFFSFIIRDNDSSNLIQALKTYLAIYVSSPTIAMQEYYLVAEKLSDSNLLRFFSKLAGEQTSTSLHRPFVDVGVPTNVYTAYSDYVFYGGVISFLMSLIHGFLAGLLWRLSYSMLWARIFYSLFAYTIVFSFFHESLVTYLSLWIQIALLSIFIGLINIRFYSRSSKLHSIENKTH